MCECGTRGDVRWQKVGCDRCGRTYTCTPADDSYCTPDGQHLCEGCLVGDLPVHTAILDGNNIIYDPTNPT